MGEGHEVQECSIGRCLQDIGDGRAKQRRSLNDKTGAQKSEPTAGLKHGSIKCWPGFGPSKKSHEPRGKGRGRRG
eukprot:1514932-Pyramimonas_sp.AAC.1